MLNWILMYELGAAISWAILFWLTWYVIVKVGGISKERFLKAIFEPDLMEIPKIALYMIIWPIEFALCAIALIQSIKVMKELNEYDKERILRKISEV